MLCNPKHRSATLKGATMTLCSFLTSSSTWGWFRNKPLESPVSLKIYDVWVESEGRRWFLSSPNLSVQSMRRVGMPHNLNLVPCRIRTVVHSILFPTSPNVNLNISIMIVKIIFLWLRVERSNPGESEKIGEHLTWKNMGTCGADNEVPQRRRHWQPILPLAANCSGCRIGLRSES